MRRASGRACGHSTAACHGGWPGASTAARTRDSGGRNCSCQSYQSLPAAARPAAVRRQATFSEAAHLGGRELPVRQLASPVRGGQPEVSAGQGIDRPPVSAEGFGPQMGAPAVAVRVSRFQPSTLRVSQNSAHRAAGRREREPSSGSEPRACGSASRPSPMRAVTQKGAALLRLARRVGTAQLGCRHSGQHRTPARLYQGVPMCKRGQPCLLCLLLAPALPIVPCAFTALAALPAPPRQPMQTAGARIRNAS